MKKLILAFFALSLTFVACSDDDNTPDPNVINEADLPTEIRTYVSTYFADRTFNRAEMETENNETSYHVFFDGNLRLEFNGTYEIVDIDDDDVLPDSVIPQSILNYVALNYPNNIITDWEIEDGYQEVELDNGLELEFTLEGIFIRVDTDNDDDDENEIVLSEAEIPAEIMAYLNEHFASNAIIRALKEMDDNTVEYEVYLDGDYELEFNENFEIISIEGITELPDSVIPQSILDYVTQNYPNDFIVEWELEDDHQQVELNNGIEIKFTLNGEFIRVDNE